MAASPSKDCRLCQKHRGEWQPPGGAIYEDDLLYVSHAEIREGEDKAFLGTIFIEPKRHADGMENLTDEEAQAVGLWIKNASHALKAATNADHIYLFRFGTTWITCTCGWWRGIPERRRNIGELKWTNGRKPLTAGRRRSPPCVTECGRT